MPEPKGFEDITSTEQTPTDFPVLSCSLSHTSQRGHGRNHNPLSDPERAEPIGEDNESEATEAEVEYPEGGREAWTVVFGSFVSMVAGFGIMNTLGTLQAHLSKDQLHDKTSGQIGWIFGVYSFLSFFGGIQIGPIFDAYGPKWLLMAGTFCLIVGLMLTSISTGNCSSPTNLHLLLTI